MLTKILLTTALAALAHAQDTSTKCNALILSGGGSLGAWEAGVYYGFTHSDQADDFHYDVVSGVSAGAINSVAVCRFAKGDDAACAEFLSEQWSLLYTEDIYLERPGGYADAILN